MCVGHVSHDWDHIHKIPSETLPHFYLLHLSVPNRDQDLKNHVSTCEGHVSHVWDHAHWIPGEILPHFYVRHVLVAHLEPKLEMFKYLEQGSVHTVYSVHINFFVLAVRKKARPLLYTNMTLTKTPIPSKVLN